MATLLSVATVESYSLRFGNRARESQSAGVGIRIARNGDRAKSIDSVTPIAGIAREVAGGERVPAERAGRRRPLDAQHAAELRAKPCRAVVNLALRIVHDHRALVGQHGRNDRAARLA